MDPESDVQCQGHINNAKQLTEVWGFQVKTSACLVSMENTVGNPCQSLEAKIPFF